MSERAEGFLPFCSVVSNANRLSKHDRDLLRPFKGRDSVAAAMLTGLGWLALEVKDLSRARAFYANHLDLRPEPRGDGELVCRVGDDTLVLREPGPVPRGGVHTHYAFSTTRTQYGEWYDRLSAGFDLVEFDFGASTSLYFYDPDGHCVEIGGTDVDGAGENGEKGSDEEGVELTGVFEIVLEVEDLPRAEEFYTDLGMAVSDRGSERRRVRLDAGPVDVELWEPQLGIADARGGVHVDVGFETEDPRQAADRVADRACAVESVEEGIRLLDPDGHYLTFL
jgi:catechol 2,3-dioxygenase-like lactoylglutathione lyase family enzyme